MADELLQLLADVELVLGPVERGRRRRDQDLGCDLGCRSRGSEPDMILRQGAQPLEGQVDDQVGRDQIQLEDRLAQVHLGVAGAADRELDLFGIDHAILDQDRDQSLVGGRRRVPARSKRDPALREESLRCAGAARRAIPGGRRFHVGDLLAPPRGGWWDNAGERADPFRGSTGIRDGDQGRPGDMILPAITAGYQEDRAADMGKPRKRQSTGDRSMTGTAPRVGSSRPIGRSPASLSQRRRSVGLTSPGARREADRGRAPASRGSRRHRRQSAAGSPRPSRAGSREPADPVEHLPQGGNLDLIARRACLDGLTGLDTERGQPRVNGLGALHSPSAEDFHVCLPYWCSGRRFLRRRARALHNTIIPTEANG